MQVNESVVVFLFAEITIDQRNTIHKALTSTNDFVDSSVFNSAKQFSCEKLEQFWINFLKEDLKIFLEYVVKTFISV